MPLFLGVDPGFERVGFGAVSGTREPFAFVDCGIIRTGKDLPFSERLHVIRKDFDELLDTLKPDAVAVEELFFKTNVTTALRVAQARGVLVEAAAARGIKVFDVTPLQMKLQVTGDGKADKKQIQSMVTRLLSLSAPPRPDDAADALGLAILAGRQFLLLDSLRS